MRIYKPGQELFIGDWLSRHNHTENKDKEIHGMDIQVNTMQTTLNIPECMSILQTQLATVQDEHLQWLKGYIIVGWPEIKDQVQCNIRTYWPFRDDMAVINGIIMKGRSVIIPDILKIQGLVHLHINHMGIEKTKILAGKSTYRVIINDDIENYIKSCATCLKFQQAQPNNKMIHHDILAKPWEVSCAVIFTLNNKHYHCIMDYNNKFPVIKKKCSNYLISNCSWYTGDNSSHSTGPS